MKVLNRTVLAVGFMVAGIASAQTCQVVNNMTYCPPAATNQNALGGGYDSPQGGGTYYNAPPRQGLPQSSPQGGVTRYYGSAASRQSIGNTDAYDNRVIRQRVGNIDYVNGKTCQQIGTMRYCN